jgi:hypothetical protein
MAVRMSFRVKANDISTSFYCAWVRQHFIIKVQTFHQQCLYILAQQSDLK